MNHYPLLYSVLANNIYKYICSHRDNLGNFTGKLGKARSQNIQRLKHFFFFIIIRRLCRINKTITIYNNKNGRFL